MPDTAYKKINIRKAKVDDVSTLMRIIRDSFYDVARRFKLTLEDCPKHPSNCMEKWIEKDFARGVVYYIADLNGKPCGCVALEKATQDLCYLERLGVLPEERKKGIGKALVDHALSEATQLDANTMNIGIISKHKELKNWYIRNGFTEGETKVFDHLPFKVTFMSFRLEA